MGGTKMAYSTEVRVNALKDYVNGQTDEQVSAKHGVSTYTLNNWKKLLLTTGGLDKKKVERKSGTPYKYTPEKIKEQLDKSRTSESNLAAKDVKSQDAAKGNEDQASTKSKDPKKDKKKKKKTKKG
jgi:transposase-like protein